MDSTTNRRIDLATKSRKRGLRVGLYGVGLDTYWLQFEGLYQRLQGYQDQIRSSIEREGVTVLDVGIVDSPEKARIAADVFAASKLDLIFLNISTYALSSTVLPVVQQVKVPVVVLSLQPTKAIDYTYLNNLGDRGRMTGEWLAYCQACSAPEIASVFNRVGIDYHLVTGSLDDEEAWQEIEEWLQAAQVREVMRNNRVGFLGHYYSGMLDVYSDMTQQAGVFGNHFELLEMDHLYMLWKQVTEAQIQDKLDQFQREFLVSRDCSQSELYRAAKTSCALDALVENYDLGSLAYYYEGEPGGQFEDLVTSLIAGNTLLTAHHVPSAGEGEIKNVQAMKIMDAFGAGGSFSELYALDLEDNIVMWGHDGPAHATIAEGRVELVPLPVYHGKPGRGLSIQMTVRHGPVTFLSVIQHGDGAIKLLVAEGESVPGPILEIGNTNSCYRFCLSAKEFVRRWCMAGPAHHAAIGLGHMSTKLEKLASLLNIELVRVC
jgi:L-arabinose isomerase